jgi:hypothetical protein
MKVVRLCKGMTPDQRAFISAADFGAMLGMKCSKLNPELCRFLMECFNPVDCCLDFGERGKIPINVETVVSVMGVPMGVHPVPYHANIDATNLIFQMLEIHDGKQPTISFLEKQLGPKYPADACFLRKFIMYLMSSVFAPNTGIHVSPKCYPALLNTEAISRMNWARFIIDIMIQTANAKDKKNRFKACMPFLMVSSFTSFNTCPCFYFHRM